MSPAEAAEFAGGPYAARAVQLRRYDDAGKRPGETTPGLEHFLPLIRALARL